MWNCGLDFLLLGNTAQLDCAMFDDSDSLKELCDQNLLHEMAPPRALGEKVADRPDEWAFVGGIGPRRSPHPGPLPSFLRECCHAKSRDIRKKPGSGDNMALSS
jgi:hypothetical protein